MKEQATRTHASLSYKTLMYQFNVKLKSIRRKAYQTYNELCMLDKPTREERLALKTLSFIIDSTYKIPGTVQINTIRESKKKKVYLARVPSKTTKS